ncbi:hypothetical protein GGH94_005328 [Coemansia aciculifera]|uniref:Integral membrane bound transporter domain-containing protein n=1 Tax=Coemansia aciculifera TaxID=417176 RepID=A0A9W8IDP1_9FUNG|nr:hypothetical protein GGH94_005328 [Coemansia aciculifera]KAJ2870903.1 hypothetical protein GGH93_005228 [Coemansia aciculifera]
MPKPLARKGNDEADIPTGSSLPTQSNGGNRASLVFQQLHASIALPNSPSHRNSGLGPWALRRSITEGTAHSHRNSAALPSASLTFDQQWWGEPEQYFARPCSPAWSSTSPYIRSAQLPTDTHEASTASKPVLVAQAAEELHPPDPPDEHTVLLGSIPGAADCQSSRWRDLRANVAKRGASAKAFAGELLPTLSSQQTSVLKAVLAYAIAALFPFVPVLRDWLGDPDYMSPHLVTNATIWFHAAKTRSGLAEGGLVGVIWVCVTSCVTYLALFIAEWLHCTFAKPLLATGGVPEALPLAMQSKVVSLVVFVFGYSWLLAFFKANANRASVGTATAISNIALYLVMLREAPIVNYKVAAATGGDGKIPWPEPGDRDSLAESVGKKTEHVLVAVLTGMTISILVGWVVRPTTAGQELRAQLSTTFSSFRRILPQLLAPIVSEDTPSNTQAKLHGAKPEELKAGLREHRQRLQQLKRQLDAIALEPGEWHVWARRAKLSTLVSCLDALSLHLSSMSSGLELRVIDHNSDAFVGDLDVEAYSNVIRKIREPVVRLGNMCDRILAVVHDLVDGALSGNYKEYVVDVCQCRNSAPCDGMCMACGMPLEDVDPATRRVLQLRAEMTEAIQVFHSDYDAAVGDLTSLSSTGGGAKPGSSTTEEQLFIVYFFVFSLREFVDELFDILPQVAAVCRQPPGPTLWRSPQQVADGVRALGSWVLMLARGLWDTGATTELETRYEVAQFTDPRSLHAPQPTTRLQRVARTVWRTLMWARRLNVKFATKYALLVTLLSLPCYWSISVYLEFRRQRLDWMVISAAAIMVPTVGGSALVSVYRILGTCAGGLAAFLVYEIGRDIPVLTYSLLVLFSVPCFHVILHGKYPKIGQFALITFGVVLINKWVAREDQGEGAGALAVRRTGAVALGIVAGMLVTVYVWPFEARVRVRQALSWWLLTASQLYDRLWSSLWQSYINPDTDAQEWRGAVGTVREYLDNEMHLQSSLLEIRALLADTLNEPRLKGPFPLPSYHRIINACQRLLDAMVAARWVMLPVPMVVATQLYSYPAPSESDSRSGDLFDQRLVDVQQALDRCSTPCPDDVLVSDGNTTEEEEGRVLLDLPLALAATALLERDEHVNPSRVRAQVEADLLRRTAQEREQRDALVALTMYVLASALILKTPLPAVLPPIHAAQRRVAEAMRHILDSPDDQAVSRIKYVFYYTQSTSWLLSAE